jgi:uncharacterized protein Veg
MTPKFPTLSPKDIRVLEYAMCFLLANWCDEEEDSMPNVSYKEAEILTQKIVDYATAIKNA